MDPAVNREGGLCKKVFRLSNKDDWNETNDTLSDLS